MPRRASFCLDRRPSSLVCAQGNLTPAEGTELPQVNSSFKHTQTGLFSVLQAQRQRGSQDCTWGHSWHQGSAKTIVVSFALIIQWHPRWARGLLTEENKVGTKSRKHCQGYPQVSAKVIAHMYVWMGHTCGTEAGDYDSKTTSTETTAATSSNCLAQTWQQLEALQVWDLTCNTNNN